MHMFRHDNISDELDGIRPAPPIQLANEAICRTVFHQNGLVIKTREGNETRRPQVVEMFELGHIPEYTLQAKRTITTHPEGWATRRASRKRVSVFGLTCADPEQPYSSSSQRTSGSPITPESLAA